MAVKFFWGLKITAVLHSLSPSRLHSYPVELCAGTLLADASRHFALGAVATEQLAAKGILGDALREVVEMRDRLSPIAKVLIWLSAFATCGISFAVSLLLLRSKLRKWDGGESAASSVCSQCDLEETANIIAIGREQMKECANKVLAVRGSDPSAQKPGDLLERAISNGLLGEEVLADIADADALCQSLNGILAADANRRTAPVVVVQNGAAAGMGRLMDLLRPMAAIAKEELKYCALRKELENWPFVYGKKQLEAVKTAMEGDGEWGSIAEKLFGGDGAPWGPDGKACRDAYGLFCRSQLNACFRGGISSAADFSAMLRRSAAGIVCEHLDGNGSFCGRSPRCIYLSTAAAFLSNFDGLSPAAGARATNRLKDLGVDCDDANRFLQSMNEFERTLVEALESADDAGAGTKSTVGERIGRVLAASEGNLKREKRDTENLLAQSKMEIWRKKVAFAEISSGNFNRPSD
ncbi:MAG: hypothetical protein LBI39_03395 [Puniceicoccales bacterium]|nr:hypothetical protein [Puniceicoccales bacterium]